MDSPHFLYLSKFQRMTFFNSKAPLNIPFLNATFLKPIIPTSVETFLNVQSNANYSSKHCGIPILDMFMSALN